MEKEELMCSICLENIDNKIKVTLKCDHYFCKACIDEWLKIKTFCPMCRNKEREEEPIFRELLFFQAEIEFDSTSISGSFSSDSDSGYSNSRDVSEENSEENSDIEEPPSTITLNMLGAELMAYLDNWLRFENINSTEAESHNT